MKGQMHMKKGSICAILFAFVLCIIFAPTASATSVWSGDGTPSNPYIISNETDLRLLSENVNAGMFSIE